MKVEKRHRERFGSILGVEIMGQFFAPFGNATVEPGVEGPAGMGGWGCAIPSHWYFDTH
jgi:hypothetical protein